MEGGGLYLPPPSCHHHPEPSHAAPSAPPCLPFAMCMPLVISRLRAVYSTEPAAAAAVAPFCENPLPSISCVYCSGFWLEKEEDLHFSLAGIHDDDGRRGKPFNSCVLLVFRECSGLVWCGVMCVCVVYLLYTLHGCPISPHAPRPSIATAALFLRLSSSRTLTLASSLGGSMPYALSVLE